MLFLRARVTYARFHRWLGLRRFPGMAGKNTTLWLSTSHNASEGLAVVVNAVYTWSKALDDASNPGADNAGTNVPQDMSNYAAEKGPSDFDHRNRFVTNFLYQIPFLKGFARMDAHRVWRLAGRRYLDTAKRERPLR